MTHVGSLFCQIEANGGLHVEWLVGCRNEDNEQNTGSQGDFRMEYISDVKK